MSRLTEWFRETFLGPEEDEPGPVHSVADQVKDIEATIESLSNEKIALGQRIKDLAHQRDMLLQGREHILLLDSLTEEQAEDLARRLARRLRPASIPSEEVFGELGGGRD